MICKWFGSKSLTLRINFSTKINTESLQPFLEEIPGNWMFASHLPDKLFHKNSDTFELQRPEVYTSAKRLFQALDLNLTLQFL